MSGEKDKVKKMVESVLRSCPESRNSDKTLFIELLKTYYQEKVVGNVVRLDELYELPNYDGVSRWRRKFQEGGEYPPTSWEVAKGRGWEEVDWKKALGYYVEPAGQLKLF